ncbi:hypothetical protein BLNAU_20664 [Blattamonas nauphoetae]|uniref:Uncharacterized protein n=1 Tax=Blattamonas nauphoetae TaxID=2049346 RepID=A0ABQ9WZ60_9EUKA|nr:hypothetical protein BLNAU_20664 [Blattamonas nauphoetae]
MVNSTEARSAPSPHLEFDKLLEIEINFLPDLHSPSSLTPPNSKVLISDFLLLTISDLSILWDLTKQTIVIAKSTY